MSPLKKFELTFSIIKIYGLTHSTKKFTSNGVTQSKTISKWHTNWKILGSTHIEKKKGIAQGTSLK